MSEELAVATGHQLSQGIPAREAAGATGSLSRWVLALALCMWGCSASAGDSADLGQAADLRTGMPTLDLTTRPRPDLAPPDMTPPVYDAGPSPPVAIVELIETTGGIAGMTTTFSQGLAAFNGPGTSACPPPIVMGDCTFQGSCSQVMVGPAVSAGRVTIGGGHPDPITLDPGAGNFYLGFSSNDRVFEGGQQIVVSGEGADVPAFSLSVTAPRTPTVTAPTLSVDNGEYSLAIDRSVDLDLSWNNVTTESILVGVFGGGLLRCVFPAQPGRATIPSAALGMLGAGNGLLIVEATATSSVTLGGYPVAFLVSCLALTEDGGGYFASTTIQ